jgi:chromosome segregation ATPase
MSNKDTDSFRLGTFEDSKEILPTEDNEIVDLQIKALNRRFRWLLVVLILVVGGLFAAGYIDLKNRFSVQKTSGIREIHNISAILEDRLNELQKRLDDFDTKIAKETAALDQKTVVLQKDLAGLRQRLETLDLSGAVKKEQQAFLQAVRKDLEPLNQKMASIQSDLAGVEKKLSAQVAPLSTEVTQNKKAIETLQARFGPASGELVNKDQMDLELLKIKKAYRQNLAAEISGLEKQIRLLVERLERLEISPPASTSRQAPSGAPQTGSNAPAGNAGIQEQNLP